MIAELPFVLLIAGAVLLGLYLANLFCIWQISFMIIKFPSISAGNWAILEAVLASCYVRYFSLTFGGRLFSLWGLQLYFFMPGYSGPLLFAVWEAQAG